MYLSTNDKVEDGLTMAGCEDCGGSLVPQHLADHCPVQSVKAVITHRTPLPRPHHLHSPTSPPASDTHICCHWRERHFKITYACT
jgi:hypothetical protein